MAKKNNVFTEHPALADSRSSVYFLLELKKVDVRLKKKKMKFYKETLKELSNNTVENQEQVTKTLPVKVEYRTKTAVVALENGPTMKPLN